MGWIMIQVFETVVTLKDTKADLVAQVIKKDDS